MRRALAAAGIVGAIAFTPLAAAAPAFAAPASTEVVVAQEAETDGDELGNKDGDDDTGRYGLMGLLGLFGLFGYKKYKEHRAAQTRTQGTTGTGTVGDVDGDGSGSRRI
jgi:hypothetical protein